MHSLEGKKVINVCWAFPASFLQNHNDVGEQLFLQHKVAKYTFSIKMFELKLWHHLLNIHSFGHLNFNLTFNRIRVREQMLLLKLEFKWCGLLAPTGALFSDS